MVTKGKSKKKGRGDAKGKQKALKLGKETVKELGDDDMDKAAGGLLNLGVARKEEALGRLAPDLRSLTRNTCVGLSATC